MSETLSMMSGHYVIWIVLIWGWLGGGAVATSYVHEIYLETDSTNRSVGCGVCEGTGGHLALRPEMDDWEYTFGNWSHLENQTFWVDLVLAESGQWVWGDGQVLDPDETSSLPMDPSYSSNFPSDWACAVWSIEEPFLMIANCSMTTNILCQREDSSLECVYKKLPGTKITDSDPALQTVSASMTETEDCVGACRDNDTCWAGHWDSDTLQCQLLLMSNSSTSPSSLPTLEEGNSSFVAFGKSCLHYYQMSPDQSGFVCNCNAMVIPETEEEKVQFLEEYEEEVKEELIVPTADLSSTTRKKTSAPDERPSSQAVGYVGLVFMVIVFGGLMFSDVVVLGAYLVKIILPAKAGGGGATPGMMNKPPIKPEDPSRRPTGKVGCSEA